MAAESVCSEKPTESEGFEDLKDKDFIVVDSDEVSDLPILGYFSTRKLGGGGQGDVFLGLYYGGMVAVKIIDTISFDGKECAVNEVEALRNLQNSKYVVKLIYDINTDNNICYIALEKCELSFQLFCLNRERYKGLRMPTGVKILLQLAKGLNYIHEEGVVHRDVKPSNILIWTKENSKTILKWADFGLSTETSEKIQSRQLGLQGSSSTAGSNRQTSVSIESQLDLTVGAVVCWGEQNGTKGWMAPELFKQTNGLEPRVGTQCDIFALGCVFFYYLKFGEHPFGSLSETAEEVQKNIKEDKRINLNGLPVSHFAYTAIEKMTRNNRKERIRMSKVIAMLKSYKSSTESAE